jgi:hypothetical protein
VVRHKPVWGVLCGSASVGLAVFWWVDGDPTRLWSQAWELGLGAAIFGFAGWWLYANRDALARAAQAEAAAHGAGPPVGETWTWSSVKGPRSNRLWHNAGSVEAPEPASPPGPTAPIDPLDRLVCHACGNIHSVIERDGMLVCQHCGYTRERPDP